MDLSLELTPARLRGRAGAELTAYVVRDLTPADLELTLVSKGTTAPSIVKIRDRHHYLARCLASGMADAEASLHTGYTASRISILKGDPAFQELLAFYHANVDAAFSDMNRRMATLGTDMVEELHSRLEEDPESLPSELVLDAIKVLADRTGNGPSSKTTNVNISVGLADRMEAGLRRVKTIEGSAE